MTPEPGSLWWCDGVALGFEAHFKRRPVLVVQPLPDGRLLVVPLSSRRRYGQEPAVHHEAGVSYLTGALTAVEGGALQRRIGQWEGFGSWRADRERAAEAAGRVARFGRWLGRLTGKGRRL